jgi:predicted phosphohydrolase
MIVMLLPFLFGAFLLLSSLDGMRIVFRGTRDYLSSSLSVNARASRLAAALAAVSCAATGVAALITLFAWVGGVRPLGDWPDSSNTQQDS